jgi:cytochrome P450
MNLFGGQLARDEHAYVAYANDRVAERLAMEERQAEKSTSRKDMMHYLLQARDPESGKPFSRSDLDADSSLLIAAGADTTSTTLAAAFFYLSLPTSRRILSRLQSQLRTTFSSVDAIKTPRIVSHQYLRAVIDEVLRLAPPVPTHLPRQIIPNEGLEIDGACIPSGTIVGVPAYAIHHDETYYPDPWSFRPERWIVAHHDSAEDGENDSDVDPLLRRPEQVQAARDAFAPFSLGSRGCVGKSLAYLELCICLARVLYLYDIRRADGTEEVTIRRGTDVRKDEFQLKDCFLAERVGPMIEFRRWNRGPRRP